ncbi:unnamed protein product, partial [Ectocarpus sp. 12 AP-2014]
GGAKPTGSNRSGVDAPDSTTAAALLPQWAPSRTPIYDGGGAAEEDGPEGDRAPGVAAPVALAATSASSRASSAPAGSPPAGTGDDSAGSRGEEGPGADVRHRGGADDERSHDDAREGSCPSDTASSDNGG